MVCGLYSGPVLASHDTTWSALRCLRADCSGFFVTSDERGLELVAFLDDRIRVVVAYLDYDRHGEPVYF